MKRHVDAHRFIDTAIERVVRAQFEACFAFIDRKEIGAVTVDFIR